MSYLIYITYPSEEEAHNISKDLLDKQLVACANIFSPHATMYKWEGKIEQGSEIAVIYKTTQDHFNDVKEAVLSQHSYECPCIVALPIETGYEGFLDWIKNEVL